MNIDSLKATFNRNPLVKKVVHRLLIPSGQAEPRWFVSWFINPFFHRRGKNAVIRRSVRLDVFPFQPFELGNNSTIEDFSVINNGVGPVRIGSGVRIGVGDVLMGPVSIGDNTILGQHVLVTGLDHVYENPTVPIKDQGVITKPTSIGKGCFIGANVSILPGVQIGDNVVIGAGSVVTRNIPDRCVAAGSPAKVIKKFDSEKGNWVKP